MIGLSVCRNPKLAAIFYRLELIEAYGTGLPKIMNAYAHSSLKPKIEVSSNAFKITLPNRNVEANKIAISTGESNKNRIVEFIKANGYGVRNDIDTLLGVSQATANRILKQMLNDGLICQEGNGRTTRYKVK
ncbi:MAG: hypothetical protein HUK24_06790 [Sphaerochaetaceae bacterium]|nr:hypothetical protein [Sphaerochaetaceae bacterium]